MVPSLPPGGHGVQVARPDVVEVAQEARSQIADGTSIEEVRRLSKPRLVPKILRYAQKAAGRSRGLDDLRGLRRVLCQRLFAYQVATGCENLERELVARRDR